jgi:ketosteroid isomerase-like protein
MRRYVLLLVMSALLIGLLGASVQAEEHETDTMEVVEAAYAAVEVGDLAMAGEYLADDAVLVLSPPPPGTDGTFVGKEAVLEWWENLFAINFRGEFSDATVSGDRFTATLDTYVDDLPVAPVEMSATGVVQDGKIKALSYVNTPEAMAKLDAAFAEMAQEQVVRRILQEIWSEGNLDLVEELVAEDYVSHTWPIGEGREHFKYDVTSWREDFPGATIVVDKMIHDGNRLIMFNHYAFPGDALDTLPPDADIDDVLIYQIEDGQLSDRWYLAPFEP